MQVKDARSLSPEAQEELRRRVVKAVEGGMKQGEAAKAFSVSRQTVNKWMKLYREKGSKGLARRKRGRPRGSRLAPHQAALTVRMLTDRCPDQLKFPFALWTRQALCNFLEYKFGVRVSVWTAGRYLRRWGFTPQKPLRRAYEQNPREVKRWLNEEYPAIRAKAKKEGAVIHWGDEMGLRSDDQRGRSYGRRGQTPVVPSTGRRFGVNMISTVTNRGELRFMVFSERFTSEVFIAFLRRLLRSSERKVYLIVDRHPVHTSKRVASWIEKNSERIEMFHLPSYSPELNPDELVNNDVKNNAHRKRRPKNRQEMLSNVRSFLRGKQRRPQDVRRYFEEENVRYAG